MRPPLHQDGIARAPPKASAEPMWMERENTSGAVRWNSESNCANPEPNIVAADRTESVRAMTGRLAHLPRDVQLDPGKARCVPGARAIPLSGFLSIPSGSAGLRTNRHPGIPQRSQKYRPRFRSHHPPHKPMRRRLASVTNARLGWMPNDAQSNTSTPHAGARVIEAANDVRSYGTSQRSICASSNNDGHFNESMSSTRAIRVCPSV